MTTPVTPTRALNSPALLIASWPVIASATNSRSDGSVAFGIPEEGHHLVANDFDDFLRRREPPQHIFVRDRVHRTVAHTVDKRFDDLEVDVRFEQRQANLAKRSLDVLGCKPGFAPERLEYVLESIAQGLEHDR